MPKYCFYNNTTNSDSIKKYGALYNWYVVSPTIPEKIAPAEWHIQSDTEWNTLQNHLVANSIIGMGQLRTIIERSLAAKTN